ncbi:Uncharacterised protein [Mycobacteroides abscessus subsp. abscessus]|nr:Uncharacterised protein [Mycobacteroides abscessus subsp. abscessus]
MIHQPTTTPPTEGAVARAVRPNAPTSVPPTRYGRRIPNRDVEVSLRCPSGGVTAMIAMPPSAMVNDNACVLCAGSSSASRSGMLTPPAANSATAEAK